MGGDAALLTDGRLVYMEARREGRKSCQNIFKMCRWGGEAMFRHDCALWNWKEGLPKMKINWNQISSSCSVPGGAY